MIANTGKCIKQHRQAIRGSPNLMRIEEVPHRLDLFRYSAVRFCINTIQIITTSNIMNVNNVYFTFLLFKAMGPHCGSIPRLHARE